jgi:hypothetical protein
MKHTLLALVVLFASLLTFGQTKAPIAPPNMHGPGTSPPATTAPAPVPAAQPIFEAGGLDNLCQAGLNGKYEFDGDKGTFGTNGPAESQTLSNASACIGYITGWEHTISGAFITEDGKLWFVEVSDEFNVTAAANLLHEYIKKNPDASKVPSPLVLLAVAVGANVARVSPVDIRSFQPDQPQREEQAPAPPVLKSRS